MNISRTISMLPTIIIISLAWTYWEYIPYGIAALFMIVAAVVIIKIAYFSYRLTHKIAFRNIDQMDGLAFEEYVAALLQRNGYSNVSLTEQYDYGVDIIADKDGIRWGIQVKRYSGLVKASAIRQVFTALNIYGCDRAMVITNSTFSSVAKTLAASTNCVLIDRSALQRMMR
ncbi:restriction endonuclease [Candidatus Saccharibacteria bacterium]|nr:restriction endonuclease [Candidatus Saccharibacteria bacterium]